MYYMSIVSFIVFFVVFFQIVSQDRHFGKLASVGVGG